MEISTVCIHYSLWSGSITNKYLIAIASNKYCLKFEEVGFGIKCLSTLNNLVFVVLLGIRLCLS